MAKQPSLTTRTYCDGHKNMPRKSNTKVQVTNICFAKGTPKYLMPYLLDQDLLSCTVCLLPLEKASTAEKMPHCFFRERKHGLSFWWYIPIRHRRLIGEQEFFIRHRRLIGEQEFFHLLFQKFPRFRVNRCQSILIDQHGLMTHPGSPGFLRDIQVNSLAKIPGISRSFKAWKLFI